MFYLKVKFSTNGKSTLIRSLVSSNSKQVSQALNWDLWSCMASLGHSESIVCLVYYTCIYRRRWWSCLYPLTPCRCYHDNVIKWKHFPRYWPFVRGIHRSPVNSPHKGQWRGALMFSFICAWINTWVNNREAGDFRRYRAHYDVIVMIIAARFLTDAPRLQRTTTV